MLTINLFGFMHVQAGQTTLTFPTDATRALLAYLVLHRDRPTSRETLATLFWPDVPTRKAMHSLRQTLVRLRQSLTEEGSDTPDPLLTDRHSIQWNLDYPVQIDVWQFETWRTRLDQISANANIHRHRRLYLLEQAVALYTGDFLAGLDSLSLTFTEWLSVERERYTITYLRLLEELTAFYGRTGQYQTMGDMARRVLAVEPWHETAAMHRMTALAAQGKWEHAAKIYQQVSAVLQTELHLPPSTTMQYLYEQIRARTWRGAPPFVPQGNIKQVAHQRATVLVGREQEVVQMSELLLVNGEHLVTILGPGGVGKTRLAQALGLAIQPYFADGVWWVSLAGVDGAAYSTAVSLRNLLAQEILQALDISFMGDEPLFDQLCDYLHGRELLFIFDNLEHLPELNQAIHDLLQAIPQLSICATSRQPIYLQAEYRFALAGLPTPPATETGETGETDESQSALATYASVQLLHDRAQRIGYVWDGEQLPLAGELCRFVDGLPLGIELMAAMMDRLSPRQLQTQLQESYSVLLTRMPDVPQRHRSISAVFYHSWQLLTPVEQEVLRRLSLFRNRFTLAAAASVAGATLADLQALAQKSLIQHTAVDEFGWHELLREYAQAELTRETAVYTAVVAQHSTYFLQGIAQRADQLARRDTVAAYTWIDRCRDDIETAWYTAVERADYPLLIQATIPMLSYLGQKQRYLELNTLAERSLQAIHGRGDAPLIRRLRGYLYCAQAFAQTQFGNYEKVVALLHQAEEIGRDTADIRLQFRAAYHLTDTHVQAQNLDEATATLERAWSLGNWEEEAGAMCILLCFRGGIAYLRQDLAQAQAPLDEALAQAQAHQLGFAHAYTLLWLCIILDATGQIEKGKALRQEALRVIREINAFILEISVTYELIAQEYGDAHYHEALAYAETCLDISQRINHERVRVGTHTRRGNIYYALGRYTAALEEYALVVDVLHGTTDDVYSQTRAQLMQVYTYFQLGDDTAAHEAAQTLAATVAGSEMADLLERGLEAQVVLAAVALARGDVAGAEQALYTAVGDLEAINPNPPPHLLARLAHEQGQVALAQGDLPTAEAKFGEALALHRDIYGTQGAVAEDLAGLTAVALAAQDLPRIQAACTALRQHQHAYPAYEAPTRALWHKTTAVQAMRTLAETGDATCVAELGAYQAELDDQFQKRVAFITDVAVAERYRQRPWHQVLLAQFSIT